MVVRITELVRLLYGILTNRASDLLLTREGGRNAIDSPFGKFWVFSYEAPEAGLSLEDKNRISVVHGKLMKDRIVFFVCWMIEGKKLLRELLLIPFSKTSPPMYINEYGFVSVSAEEFNEMTLDLFGIESLRTYLPI